MKKVIFLIFCLFIFIIIVFIIVLMLVVNYYQKKLLKQKTLLILEDEKNILQEQLFLAVKNLNDLNEMNFEKNEEFNFYLKENNKEINIIEKRIKKINKCIKKISKFDLKYYELFNIVKRNCLNYENKFKSLNYYNRIVNYNYFSKYQNIIKIQKRVIMRKKIKLWYLKVLVFLKGVK